MTELVAAVLHRLGGSAKRFARVLPLCAVGGAHDTNILGFADPPNRRSTVSPLQLKGIYGG
jgi:hypothetical protein